VTRIKTLSRIAACGGIVVSATAKSAVVGLSIALLVGASAGSARAHSDRGQNDRHQSNVGSSSRHDISNKGEPSKSKNSERHHHKQKSTGIVPPHSGPVPGSTQSGGLVPPHKGPVPGSTPTNVVRDHRPQYPYHGHCKLHPTDPGCVAISGASEGGVIVTGGKTQLSPDPNPEPGFGGTVQDHRTK
jgi:hypothetical protein